MRKVRRIFTASIFFLLTVALLVSCAPLTAEESNRDHEYYETKYADEAVPSAEVQSLLDLLDTCVGGKYIFGGQGDPITTGFIDKTYELYPDYFSDGRLEYFTEIAEENDGWEFPEDYAWDCSGLWWYAVNVLGLYDEYTDRTASDTYYDYCTPIGKDELRPGDIVFLENIEGKIVHMAIVGRQGYIYEAVGGFCGVVRKRTVDRRIYNNIVNGGVLVYDNWNMFGRPKIFED